MFRAVSTTRLRRSFRIFSSRSPENSLRILCNCNNKKKPVGAFSRRSVLPEKRQMKTDYLISSSGLGKRTVLFVLLFLYFLQTYHISTKTVSMGDRENVPSPGSALNISRCLMVNRINWYKICTLACLCERFCIYFRTFSIIYFCVSMWESI